MARLALFLAYDDSPYCTGREFVIGTTGERGPSPGSVTTGWRRSSNTGAQEPAVGEWIEFDVAPMPSQRFLEVLAYSMTPGDSAEVESFRQIFLRHVDRPKRVAGKIVPEKYLTFDSANHTSTDG